MTAEPEVIEGRALEVVEPREIVRLAQSPTPEATIELAARMATALKDIVEKQKLYAVIQGKKYPQVEAWMTIGRMDNVVAREVIDGIVRHDDGSYEATVELIRLSDGMVIGRGSALCGTPGDNPWASRPEPARRSMAVTRATSRAFRQQYSWIMALAGYEPTPADEMPHHAPNDRRDEGDGAAARQTTHRDGLIGKAIAQGTQDFQLRQGPEGPSLPFRVKEGKLSQIVVATGPIATALDTYRDETLGQRITVWGTYSDETYYKGDDLITYKVLHVERIKTPAFEMPSGDAPAPTTATETPAEPTEAASEPLPFDMAAVDAERLDPEERLLVGGNLS